MSWAGGSASADVGKLPILPAISGKVLVNAVKTFKKGKSNPLFRPTVFAKIGDSITDNWYFLAGYGCNNGDYSNANPKIESSLRFWGTSLAPEFSHVWCENVPSLFRSNSMSRFSASARSGWTIDREFIPGLVTDRSCDTIDGGKDTPLVCEYQLLHPSMALVMLGTNDLAVINNVAAFKAQLKQLVQLSLDSGTIPVLSTLPPRLDCKTSDECKDRAQRVAAYNDAIAQVANNKDSPVPLMNYWRALVETPAMVNQGMSSDGIHPNIHPTLGAFDYTGDGLHYGFNQRNYIALLTLYRLQNKVVIPNRG